MQISFKYFPGLDNQKDIWFNWPQNLFTSRQEYVGIATALLVNWICSGQSHLLPKYEKIKTKMIDAPKYFNFEQQNTENTESGVPYILHSTTCCMFNSHL